MNALDRVINWVSPTRGLERARARVASEGLGAARMLFDATQAGRRTEGWRAVATDANAEIRGQGDRLRNVARDMVRNNPHAARAKAVIANNVVGAGIIPSIQAANPRVRAELDRLMKAHFDTTACDANGLHDLYGLQHLAMGTVAQDGEVLVRYRPRRPEDGLPLPFQLQVIEADHLDNAIDGPLSNGNWASQGIEFDLRGKRVAYWLFQDHPGAMTALGIGRSVRVPAEFVAHIFRVDRPGQARGVSWFAPVIMRLRDLADFADAQLMRQKIAACFAGFIEMADPLAGAPYGEKEEGQPHPVEKMAPGMIRRMGIGEKITFGEPPQVDGFGDYMSVNLHEIAAGMGISYEALTGDLKGVNFSSGRLGWLEFQRSVGTSQNHIMIPQLCHRVGAWTLNAASVILSGRDRGATIGWTPPRREMIDPTREVPASIMAIRGGLASRSNEQRKLGFDPEDLDAEMAADNARADKLGLALDSDPRILSQAGQTQAVTIPPERD